MPCQCYTMYALFSSCHCDPKFIRSQLFSIRKSHTLSLKNLNIKNLALTEIECLSCSDFVTFEDVILAAHCMKTLARESTYVMAGFLGLAFNNQFIILSLFCKG